MNEIFSGITPVLDNGNIRDLKTPCYVIDEKKLTENAETLKSEMVHTGCKILLAQTAFSN